MKNRTLLNLLGLGYACALGSTSASAAILIGFETSEGYATAPAAFTNGTGNAQGWSPTTSNNVGQLITTSTSGDYVGGQALSTNTDNNGQSYIGAVNLGLTGFTTITFDIGIQPTSVNPGQTGAYVGGWADGGTIGQFTQGETGPGGGLRDGQFVIRTAGMGTAFGTGVSGTAGSFYRMTLGLNFATNTVTLDAFNLTTSTLVDLNGGSAGNTFSATDAGMFGGVDPSTYTGVVARASGFGIVDNINVIPEPSTAGLMGGVGMLALLRRRRK